jgi:hypothetical protein
MERYNARARWREPDMGGWCDCVTSAVFCSPSMAENPVAPPRPVRKPPNLRTKAVNEAEAAIGQKSGRPKVGPGGKFLSLKLSTEVRQDKPSGVLEWGNARLFRVLGMSKAWLRGTTLTEVRRSLLVEDGCCVDIACVENFRKSKRCCAMIPCCTMLSMVLAARYFLNRESSL